MTAAACALLALPSVATADTTVDPSFGGTCQRNATCKTIQEAVTASDANDTIVVKPGAYSEAVSVPNGKNGLTIRGELGAAIVGSLAVSANEVKIAKLAISRSEGTDAAVTLAGTGIQFDDSTVVSTVGHGVQVTGDGTIRRSIIASALATANGLNIEVAGAGARTVEVDSSIVLGGAGGASVNAVTTGSGAGSLTLDLRHVTLPGAAGQAIKLDSSAARGVLTPVGNITANITGSIVHGLAASTARNYLDLLTVATNQIVVKFSNVDSTAMTGSSVNTIGQTSTSPANPNIDIGAPSLTPDNQLFDGAFHLLATSPAIDKGGALVGDESQTDVDGEPRVNGGQSDIGADEYTNKPPVAKSVTAAPTAPKSGQPTTLTVDATDPNGGDVLTYAFSFGDGESASSQTASVQHTYARPGSYNVQVAVVDAAGATSGLVSATITVTDGTAPTLAITGRKLLVKRHELRIRGTVADESGVQKVEIALTRRAGCRHYTPSGFQKAAGKCKQTLRWINAPLIGGTRFEVTTNPDVKIPKGTYVLRARATDKAGNTNTRFRAGRTQVTVKVP